MSQPQTWGVHDFWKKKKERTFGQDLPLARFAAGRIWQNCVQLVEEVLHFASPFPLGHFVAVAQLGGTAVAALGGRRCGLVGVLQIGDAAMLHGMVVGCREI